jgi:hypothetical protein
MQRNLEALPLTAPASHFTQPLTLPHNHRNHHHNSDHNHHHHLHHPHHLHLSIIVIVTAAHQTCDQRISPRQPHHHHHNKNKQKIRITPLKYNQKDSTTHPK